MTTMDFGATLNALRKLHVETGSLACLGCGYEHNCSTHGCAILRNAIEHMEAALSNYDSLSALVDRLETELKSEILSAAEIRAKLANEWVSVEERLPRLRENVLVCAFWHEHWGVYMGWNSGHGWTVSCGLGQRSDVQVSHWMPLPAPPDRRPPEGRKHEKEEKNHMTYFEAFRTLPSDQLARLLLCPNQTARRYNPIPCTLKTPEHTSCDQCIAAFLLTEVDPRDAAQ